MLTVFPAEEWDHRKTASDRGAPVLKILGLLGTPSLLLLTGPLCPGMVVVLGVPSMSKIDMFEITHIQQDCVQRYFRKKLHKQYNKSDSLNLET